MSSTTWRGRELLGSQTPRVWSAPSAATSAGPEAVRLGELVGLDPLPWQRFVCEHALGQNVDASGEWRWAAFEVVLVVGRQNGKSTILEILELYCAFSLGLNVYHTAHLFSTARKSCNHLLAMIDQTPQLAKRVRHVEKKADQVTIHLTSGRFITYMARSSRAGRGFADGNVLVFDEAGFLDALTMEALVPTLTTREHPLLVYAGSAGLAGSSQLRALRRRMEAGDPSLAGFEWSIDSDLVEQPDFDPLAPDVVAQANPSLGGLFGMEYVHGEYGALTMKEPTESDPNPLQGWFRERLGVPDADPSATKRVISLTAWKRREDLDRLPPAGRVVLAVASAWPDRAWSSIVVAGRRADGDRVVKVLEHRPGDGWVLGRLRELVDERGGAPAAIDPGGPAGGLIEDIEGEDREPGQAPIRVLQPTPREVAHSSADLLQAVTGEAADLWHYDQPELTAATVAGRRSLGDLWLFSRRGGVDISPLEATVLALWALDAAPNPGAPPSGLGAAAASSGPVDLQVRDVRTMGF